MKANLEKLIVSASAAQAARGSGITATVHKIVPYVCVVVYCFFFFYVLPVEYCCCGCGVGNRCDVCCCCWWWCDVLMW